MSVINTLLELWVLMFLCILLGRATLRLLPSTLQLQLGFYLSPIIGLAVLLLCVTLFGWLSPFSFTPSLVGTLTLAFIALFFDNRKATLPKQVLYLSIFTCLCALPVIAPLFRYGGYNPFTDIFTYLAQSQWLQTHSFAEKATPSGFYPTLTQIALYQKTGSRMGGTFLLAYVQSLFDIKWSYNAYLATVSLGFVSGCLAIGGIVRQVIPVRKLTILGLSLLPAFLLNGYVFGAMWGFYPQTLGLAFSAGVAALLPAVIQHVGLQAPTYAQISRYALPPAFCTAAMLFAYNEPFPIFALAVVAFFVIASFTFKKQLNSLFYFFSLYFLETVLFVNYEIVRIFNNIFQTLGVSGGHAAIGWPVFWSPIQFFAHAFGLKSPFTHGSHSFYYFLSTWVASFFIAACLLILISFVRIKSKRRLAIALLVCINASLLVFFVLFRYFSESPSPGEIGHTFLQYKVIKYAVPFTLGLTGISLAAIWFYRPKSRPALIVLLTVVVLHGLYFHGIRSAKHLTTHFLNETKQQHDPFSVLLNLRNALSSIPHDKVIFLALGEEHSKLRQMVAYILHDRKLASNYLSDGYLVGSLPPSDRVMSSDDADYLLIMKDHQQACQLRGQIIEPFLLLKPPFRYINVQKSMGTYPLEANGKGDTWNWVNKAADFHLDNIGASKMLKVNMILTSHMNARAYAIIVQDQKGEALARFTLPQKAGSTSFESPWIETRGNEHLILHVEADGAPERLSNRDPREATFMVSNVTVCPGKQ